jgi:hypothetical protein
MGIFSIHGAFKIVGRVKRGGNAFGVVGVELNTRRRSEGLSGGNIAVP